MSTEIHSCGAAGNDDAIEKMFAAALCDDADIPSASESFARNCISYMSGGRDGARSVRFFRVAAASAILSSLATWTAVVHCHPALQRPAETAPAHCIAVAEDVAAVGVNAPQDAAADARGIALDSSLAVSNESMVNTNPGATVFWKALNAGQSQMAWEWPDGARSARLTITGCGLTAEKVYGKSDAFPVWNPPVPADFSEDDVYTARLTFYRGAKGTGEELSHLVATGIGFVRGVSGAESQFVVDSMAFANLARLDAHVRKGAGE